jgi:CBS domain-containing protein
VGLLDWVRAADDAELLERYAGRLADAAGAELDRDALAAGRAIATVNDALTRRLIAKAESELGPPPCPYAWLALGSQGRREQSLLTDQDHALAYAPDAAAAPQVGEYFAALGDRVTEALRRAGFPYCPGGYMAKNWHRSMLDWQATFHAWIDRPSSQGVVEAEVFLDYRRVHGDLGLRPIDGIVRSAANRPRFLILMARAAVTFRPPLRFGRIHGRELDLKTGGLAPIVLLARLYVLAGGTAATHTPDRLEAAAHTGHVSAEGAARLTKAYRVLTHLRLQSQLREVAGGRPATNVVRLNELTGQQRSELTEALHAVREHQQATELRFHTETVS